MIDTRVAPRSAAPSFSTNAIALVLVALLVGCSVLAVIAAGWVGRLSMLLPLAMGGLAVGALFGRLRLPALVLHLVGVLFGEGIALWAVASTLPGATFGAQVALLAGRSAAWIGLVRGGGVATDNLLFLLALACLVWFVGYSAAFLVIRAGSPWWAIATAGGALFVNVSFTSRPLPYVPIFLVVALLLVVQLSQAGHERAWQRAGLSYAGMLPSAALPIGLLASVGLVATALLAPTAAAVKSSAEQLQVLGAVGSEPLANVKDELRRAFGGVQGSKDQASNAFGAQITLQSEFNLGQEIVAEVSAPRGRYWRAVTYQDYTGRGWKVADDTSSRAVGGGERHPSVYRARAALDQRVTIRSARGDTLLAAGQPIAFDVPSTLDYPGAAGDPLALDLASAVRSPRARVPGLSYVASSSVSTADESTLRTAGAEYPAAIRQRYGQAPVVPARVRELARNLAPPSAAPYDRARAIEGYLRTNYAYRVKVPAPPAGRDGVDFFLFDSKAGYCDYFATAMTVLLREAGVPARMVSGYAIGEPDPANGRWIVRDANAHSWVEVYFPEYGWVEFEPSPIRAVPARGDLGPAVSPTPAPTAAVPTPLPGSTPATPPTPSAPAATPTPTAAAGLPKLPADLPIVPLVVAMLAIGGLGLSARTAWRWGIADLPPAEIGYARMARLAGLIGRGAEPAQTPREFALALGGMLPAAAPAAEALAEGYLRSRWSREGGQAEAAELEAAWRQVRAALLRSLIPRSLEEA